MRILYHHRTRGEDAQGVHIRALCRGFRELGHRVWMVAPGSRFLRGGSEASGGDDPACRRGGAGSRPVSLGRAVPPWLYEIVALAYNIPAFFALSLAVARRRPDFIYERYTLFTVAGLWVARLFRLPFVLEVNAPLSLELQQHGRLCFRRLARWVENWLCREATRTVVVSRAMAEIFIGRGVPARRLLVIPNGVDRGTFHPGVDGSRERVRYGLEGLPVIGFVGWVRPWHGVEQLVDAVAELSVARPDLRLLVVGDGPALDDLRRRAAERGVEERVIFTGAVARERVPDLIAAMDVAVQPDVTDYASPIKLFEYLALGKAVVAPARSNITEVVRDGNSALLFPPRDWKGMASRLKRLFDDPETRRALGQRAAALIEERGYHWTANARRSVEAVRAATGESDADRPRLLVYSHIFPNRAQPAFGVFVRERMFRVAHTLPIVVVAPVPWFPGQGLLRKLRPGYRPPDAPYHELQGFVHVYHPRFLCVPRFMKWADGPLEALCTAPALRRIRRRHGFDLIDAHFVYPDGVAAWLLARWFRVPYTITLRGTIVRISRTWMRRWLARRALSGAARIFAVADSLRRVAVAMGEAPERIHVIPNGVNTRLFFPEERTAARQRIGVPETARVLVSVGTLNERKGFHRVMEVMPALAERHPDLRLVIAGGVGPDGNNEAYLRGLARARGLEGRVHFLGPLPPEELRWVYSAGDLFVLATRFEGWANVFLEAAACGLPIVTTDVGGNAEVVHSEEVGLIVPYGQPEALRQAIDHTLTKEWDCEAITAYARANAWETRIPALVDHLCGACGAAAPVNGLQEEESKCATQ